MEFCPSSIEEYGRQPKEIFEFLYSLGFKVYHLDRKSKQLIKPIVTQSIVTSKLGTEMHIEQFIEQSNKTTTNLLVKSE